MGEQIPLHEKKISDFEWWVTTATDCGCSMERMNEFHSQCGDDMIERKELKTFLKSIFKQAKKKRTVKSILNLLDERFELTEEELEG